MLRLVVAQSDPAVAIVDETYVEAPPPRIAQVLTHPDNVATAWPHVRTRLLRDRGPEGAVWAVEGLLEGEFEIWIEPHWDGAIVHHYVRASAPGGRGRRIERAHIRRWKRHINAVKDALEPPRSSWRLGGGESVRSQTPGL